MAGRRKGLGLLFALALVWLGCKDINVTYKNKTPRTQTKICVVIKIKNAPTFPPVSEWYNNSRPTVTPLAPGVPDANGFYFYKLCWNVNVPPGGSVHVGGTFASSQTVEQVNSGWEGPVGVAPFGGASMRPRQDATLGLVLDVYNSADSPGGFTVQQLQWAPYTEHVALNNLDWTDPVLALLPWSNVTSTPFHLVPGDTVTFDIPDDALAGKPYALVRWVTDDDEGSASEEAVIEIPVQSLTQVDGDVAPQPIHP